MNKKMVMGFISYGLIFIALIMAISFKNKVCIGDSILNMMGIKAWSHGTMGIHCTVIYAFIVVILAWIASAKLLGEKYEKLVRSIPAVILLLLLIVPRVVNAVW